MNNHRNMTTFKEQQAVFALLDQRKTCYECTPRRDAEVVGRGKCPKCNREDVILVVRK